MREKLNLKVHPATGPHDTPPQVGVVVGCSEHKGSELVGSVGEMKGFTISTNESQSVDQILPHYCSHVLYNPLLFYIILL